MTDPMQGVFRGFDIAASGLRAELQRSEVVASNLGNMHRTGNAQHEPYRRKVVVFEEALDQARGALAEKGDPRAAGVQIARVREDNSPFPVFYQPGHPDADESGKVLGSNVDLFQELVDMSIIERSFEANLTALRTYRTMLQNTISNMSR
ncbi:MAG TPA: flagellar basal body rod protein FlgC [Planctomycetota bacterium]|nr:flagellar basal body rod protein FlgC [Planctomycetota bacterium]